MAIETERFQVAGTGDDFVLVDTATGRSWKLVSGRWRPMEFIADAPAAPVVKRVAARVKRAARAKPAG